MIVKMKETVQGRDIEGELRYEGTRVKILECDEEYIVDPIIGVWLVEHGKADDITPAKPQVVIEKAKAPEVPQQNEQPVQNTGKRGRK